MKIRQYDCRTGQFKIIDVPDEPPVPETKPQPVPMDVSLEQLRADIDYIAMEMGIELE